MYMPKPKSELIVILTLKVYKDQRVKKFNCTRVFLLGSFGVQNIDVGVGVTKLASGYHCVILSIYLTGVISDSNRSFYWCFMFMQVLLDTSR